MSKRNFNSVKELLKKDKIEIFDFDQVKFDQTTGAYTYDDGDNVHTLDPRNMIIRTNTKAPNSPMIYVDWNDRELKGQHNAKTCHPTRCWYSDKFGIKYYDVREITLKRWFNLNSRRKQYSDLK